MIPHYIQNLGRPAVVGAGSGVFACPCGQSALITGFEPRNFLGIAIRCAACGAVAETAGLPPGEAPPRAVILVERGAANPPETVTNDIVLISREEMGRLETLYRPRTTDRDLHVIDDDLLDEVAAQQRRWTDAPLGAAPAGYKDQPLAWAVGHLRARLREPGWTTFADDNDVVAMTVIAAFRDLHASWGHHPMFDAMAGTAAAQGFSLHAAAIFGAAKALTVAGNRVGFVAAEGHRPRIVAIRLIMGGKDQMSIAVNRFDRFEWPAGASATPALLRGAVIGAMASVQGSINRLRPGILVLSGGAADGVFDQMLVDAVATAIGSHGKRHRGLAAVASIFPKIHLTGRPCEAAFGFSFYPAANRNHSIGGSVRIGTRADHDGS